MRECQQRRNVLGYRELDCEFSWFERNFPGGRYPSEDRTGVKRLRNSLFAWVVDGASSVDNTLVTPDGRTGGDRPNLPQMSRRLANDDLTRPRCRSQAPSDLEPRLTGKRSRSSHLMMAGHRSCEIAERFWQPEGFVL